MIFINDKPEKDHYIINDKMVIDIESKDSSLSDKDILKYIASHDGTLPKDTVIKAYKRLYTGSNFDSLYNIPEEIGDMPYNKYLDNEELTNAEDITRKSDREMELRKFFINYKSKFLHYTDKFEEIGLKKEDLMRQVYDSLFILPSLYNEDISIEDKMKYSDMGRRLMLPDFIAQYAHHNPFPGLSDIRFYESLNPYEKRIIEDEHYHHLALLKEAKMIKEGNGNTDRIITRDMLTGKGLSPAEDLQKERFLYAGTDVRIHFNDVKTRLDDAFKEDPRFHGHSPRIIDDMTNTLLRMYKGNVKDIVIRDYVKGFNLNSIKKIAKYHNAALLSIQDKVNFAEMKEDHIKAIASTLKAETTPTLIKKGFFDWYNANKDVSVNDLMLALSEDTVKAIPKYDKDTDIYHMIYDISQLKGRKEAEEWHNAAGYDFNINDVAIRGRNIQVTDGTYTIMMLQKDDYRNFTIGYDTNCCQHMGSVGASCLNIYCRDPYAGAVVIVKNDQVINGKWLKGGAIAQAFTWVDNKKDTIVFDNMEFARAGSIDYDLKIDEFNDIIAKWGEVMPYKNFHIGTGCNNGMAGWGQKIESYEFATMPMTYGKLKNIYSDYHAFSARTMKRDGKMLIKPNNAIRLKVSYQALVPSHFDKLKGHECIAGIGGRNIEDSIKYLEEFKKNPTDAKKQEMYHYNPYLIKEFPDSVPEDIQIDVYKYHKDLLTSIKNPSEKIAEMFLKDNPYTIFNYDNPSRDLWKIAVSGDGFLIQNCPYKDDEIIHAAVRNNGLSIQYIEDPSPEIQIEAVSHVKEAINFIVNPCHEAVAIATNSDMSLIGTMEGISYTDEMRLIEEDPSNILLVENPSEDLISMALEHNGLLLRNFPNATDEMKLKAVSNNGMAIRFIRNPSKEMIDAAILNTPRALRWIPPELRPANEINNNEPALETR